MTLSQTLQNSTIRATVGALALIIVAAVLATSNPVLLRAVALGIIGLAATQMYLLLRRQLRLETELAIARKHADHQRMTAHDMASALLAIQGGLYSLRQLQGYRPTTSDVQRCAQQQFSTLAHHIDLEVDRARRLVEDRNTLTATTCVASAIEPLLQLRRAAGTDIFSVFDDRADVAISSDDLARCVSNMLDNCARYASNSRIEVSGICEDGMYKISVADHGPGMAKTVRENPFDLGISTRSGGGSGLASVRSLVERSGGSVSLSTSPLGTEVQLALPAILHTSQYQRSKNEVGSRHR